ncbi:HalOD1 output domain-containing protein [Halorubrum sp. N11]|uniref:HalOD1 output domain-containing protein n=1 Tax=Halorubrum sp. N11 TaxID=3402276 RepID=UPI003EBF5960
MSDATSNSRGNESVTEAVAEAVSIEYGDNGLSPSRAVVEAVAAAAGVEPADLSDETGIVLYDYVDPDALDALVASHREAGLDVSMSLADYDVSVNATAVVAERAR